MDRTIETAVSRILGPSFDAAAKNSVKTLSVVTIRMFSVMPEALPH
jgi:hypothetical protein